MTIISMEEMPGSREVGFNPPTVTTKWIMEGVFSSDTATQLALDSLPTEAFHPHGILYRQDISVRGTGHKLFEIIAPYGQMKREQGEYHIEVGSCSVHLSALQGKWIATYPDNTYPSHDGLINVRSVAGGTVVQGFNDDLAAVKITVHFKHPRGVITTAKIRALSRLKGSVDTEGVLGFAPYEAYFMDFDGIAGSDCETEIAYHLAVRENQTDLTMGLVTGIAMKGWDIAWGHVITYADETSGRAAGRYQYVNVVRIPRERPLKTLLGF